VRILLRKEISDDDADPFMHVELSDGGTLTFRGNGKVYIKRDDMWFIGAWAATSIGQFPLWEALEM